MKIILDISALGLGEIFPRAARGGMLRADEHIIEELAVSGACDLAFCANHSSAAFEGARRYLGSQTHLAGRPLLGPPQATARSLFRRGLTSAYRHVRPLFRSRIPGIVRSSRRIMERAVHPPVADSPDGADVFHSTSVALPARPSGRSPQRFLTVYDVRHRRFPHLSDASSAAAMDAILRTAGPEDWFITSSEASRSELVEFGVAEAHQVFVVPLAADPRLFHPCTDTAALQRVRARYGIGDAPYVLSVNSIDARKNMPHAVRAFARLVRQERLGDLQYVIAGHGGSGSSEMAAALEEASDVRRQIVHTGFVEDEDLAALYSGAIVFLYPSFYEGFGLPPLEAMNCGTPVVTSNVSSLPEVVGDAGIMVPAHDLDALCQVLLEVATNAGLRESLRMKSLARASEFSWQRTASILLDAYGAAVGNAAGAMGQRSGRQR